MFWGSEFPKVRGGQSMHLFLISATWEQNHDKNTLQKTRRSSRESSLLLATAPGFYRTKYYFF